MYEMVFALSEMYKVRREYAIRFEASAFTFHVVGSRLYHWFVPRYSPHFFKLVYPVDKILTLVYRS